MRVSPQHVKALRWVAGERVVPPLSRQVWLDLEGAGMISVDPENGKAALTEKGSGWL